MNDEIPAAWYADPDDDGVSERWWDGNDWSETTRPRVAPALASAPATKPRPTPGPPATTAVARRPAAAPVQVHDARTAVAPSPQPRQQANVLSHTVKRFYFDGGAATYVGTGLLAFFITVFTFGFCTPFAIVLFQRWHAKHTYIEGHRLIFFGSAVGLFGQFVKWWLLTIITIGIYSFWVIPRMTKWVVENTDFDPAWQNARLGDPHGSATSSPVPH